MHAPPQAQNGISCNLYSPFDLFTHLSLSSDFYRRLGVLPRRRIHWRLSTSRIDETMSDMMASCTYTPVSSYFLFAVFISPFTSCRLNVKSAPHNALCSFPSTQPNVIGALAFHQSGKLSTDAAAATRGQTLGSVELFISLCMSCTAFSMFPLASHPFSLCFQQVVGSAISHRDLSPSLFTTLRRRYQNWSRSQSRKGCETIRNVTEWNGWNEMELIL